MAGTFGALLAERRAALAGRDAELAALLGLLEPGGPLAAIVHGVAGCGKSALLRAFRAEAAARGAAVVADRRPGDRADRARASAPRSTTATRGGAGRRRRRARRRRGRAPAADRRLAAAGAAASLPAHVRLVLATRDAPGAVWRSAFGELLRTVPLGPLAPADACEVLRRAGLDEEQAAWVNRFTRGHPLSLQLAASAVRARPHAPEDAILPTVVQELAALYLDGLDAATREALDATSVLRRVTLSLLEAVVPGEPPQEAFARLAALPFAELGREGLVIHDTVREAVAALLRSTDPVRHRAYRAAAWRQIRRELASCAGAARWASVADMLALVEEPLVREAFFPSSVQHYAVERARPDDGAAIEAIAARHETPEEVALVRAWWEACRMRSASRATRAGASSRSRCCASSATCRGGCSTRTRSASHGGATSPSTRCPPASRCCSPARRSRTRPARRPRRAWPRCCATSSAPRWTPGRRCGGSTRSCAATRCWRRSPRSASRRCRAATSWSAGWRTARSLCDLGPESVAGWVSRLAADDPSVGATRLDGDARELVLDGRRIALTKLECDVLAHLREHEGRPVTRESLLREVWGYEWTGGSNVVEVAVSGLRRKLGSRAGALETVRGVGYRLREL